MPDRAGGAPLGRWGANALTLVVSSLVALYLGESVLVALDRMRSAQRPPAECAQIAGTNQGRCTAAVRAGFFFDTRSARAVLDSVEAIGQEMVPAIEMAQLAPDGVMEDGGGEIVPLAGAAHESRLYCNESGEWISYVSDEFGFRNPPGMQAMTADVILLGDSFVHGYCVASDEDFAGMLRRQVPRTVALGYDGNGPLRQLASLREFGAPLRPPVVVWFFYEGNDFRDLERETRTVRCCAIDAETQRRPPPPPVRAPGGQAGDKAPEPARTIMGDTAAPQIQSARARRCG